MPFRATAASLFVLGLGMAALAPAPAGALSIDEALALAYENNPDLQAARAELRATDEIVPQARSLYYPQIDVDAQVGVDYSETELERGEATGIGGGGDFDVTSSSTDYPKSVGLTIAQPIYRGGRTDAAVNQAENLVRAQRAALQTQEQTTLLDAATVYLDVLRDLAVVELNANNEQVLRRQLEASQDRFRVGEITRTDVSQSESRVALAQGDRRTAEGTLQSRRATFLSIVGVPAVNLEQPVFDHPLPGSEDEAVALARASNPRVLVARWNEAASRDAIDVARGDLLPELNLVGSARRTYDSSDRVERVDSASLTARLSIPIWDGGRDYAELREARQTASQRLIEIESASRFVAENASRAWETLIAARATIEAREAQLEATEIALEGVRQEADVGSRTILDILDAEQEFLNAQVSLVQARRDALVAAYALLAAVGRMTAESLELDTVVYDPQANNARVREQLFGAEVETLAPVPAAPDAAPDAPVAAPDQDGALATEGLQRDPATEGDQGSDLEGDLGGDLGAPDASDEAELAPEDRAFDAPERAASDAAADRARRFGSIITGRGGN